MDERYLPCCITFIDKIKEISDAYDSIVVIEKKCCYNEVDEYLKSFQLIDRYFDKDVSCFLVPNVKQKVIFSYVGDVTDYFDVRCYFNAAAKGIQRSILSGSKSIVLFLPQSTEFENATLLKQLRDVDYAKMIENSKNVARDIGGGDPERMTAIAISSYVSNIIMDSTIFISEYPLFAAVNRCAATVPRHAGRIVFMEYKPPKLANKTIILIGKGVTYDTGGADIKAGGVMAGMSRDKCGAANVAGFMKLVDHLKPENVIVIGVLCLVRNSVGSESFVADELITSRAGVRVRIGNTDAEGRLCMADSLCQMKDKCISENLPNPHLYTIATLTGHACLSHGSYSIVIDNGPARKENHALKLKEVGELCGDPFEISTLRKEDYDFHLSTGYGEDLLQCNNLPSSKTPRGHQIPAAFLISATGLDKHGIQSAHPIKYSHIDIAGSAGDVPDIPTGASILALAKLHLEQ
uniref:CSON002374 protein n=1 Tax=Culicoides sonorensis TaxID=179676 RepID=A0A336LSC8_CULSO